MLTSGGDCQALNAAMRGVVKTLFHKGKDVEIIGFEDGYKGLIYGNYKKLSEKDFSGILTLGGTILGSSRMPFKQIGEPDEHGIEMIMKNEREICYTNRELSWLSFNERVLNEAANPKVPLAERLTFVSIFQTNLDEFYRVRVGTLMTQMNAKEKIYENKTGMSSEEQVREILKQTRELENKKAKIYEQLMGELEPQGIRIVNFNKLSNEEGKCLEKYFDEHIAPFLSPMIIGNRHPFPFLNNGQLYAIVLLKTQKKKNKIGIVPCGNTVFERLIEIPTRPGTFMLSEELILHFISKLYSNYTIREKSIMRVTRNADIDESEVNDEDLDYRNVMAKLIKKRNKMTPVRVELSRKINEKAKKELSNYLELGTCHFINVETPLQMSFVFQLQNYLSSKFQLFYENRTPRNSSLIDLKTSVIPQIEKKDVLLSYPFESMKPFIKLLEEAAVDESVVSIKMTLYRVAGRSQIIDALVEAAENGFSYITQIGTGNYNEKTARLYTDLSLITADQEIGKDAAKVFSALQKGEVVEESKELLVAPKCLQNNLLALMDEQIQHAEKGEKAYIGIKMNSLTDKALINKLMEASQAGVTIDLIVRGICCLKPGVEGKTEHIRVISIVGRYLEHSRIYIFGADENQKIYISSADFMTRNTIRRVEVAAPIKDEELKKRVREMFDTMILDDEKGKEQHSDGTYHDRKINEQPINSQEFFYEQAYLNAGVK